MALTAPARAAAALRQHFTTHRLRQAAYAPLLATGMAIMFARLLVMAHILPVEEFAGLSAGLIVSALVSTAACLGLYLDLQRTLPVMMVKRRLRAASAALGRTVIAGLLIGVLGAAAVATGVTIGGAGSAIMLLGLVHGVAQQLFLVVTTESRSNNEPMRYAVQHFVRSLASVAIGVGLALEMGTAFGVLLGEVAVAIVAVVWISAGVARRLGSTTGRTAALGLRSLRSISWLSMASLLSYSLAGAVSIQADRWLSSVTLPAAVFAQYSFAWVVVIAALYVQALINASVYPVMAQRFALAGPARTFRFAALSSAVLLACCIVAAVPSLLVANALVAAYLPKYEPALSILPLLTVAAILRVCDFFSSLAIIAGRERQMLVVTIVTSGATLALWYAVSGFGGITPEGLAWLAVATAASSLLGGLAVAIHVGRSGEGGKPVAAEPDPAGVAQIGG